MFTIVLRCVFQSTLPIQGETDSRNGTIIKRKSFQSTLPIQGETECRSIRERERRFQSTLPIQGETSVDLSGVLFGSVFQSTLPIQGETGWVTDDYAVVHISIHSPYTGRDPVFLMHRFHLLHISIHSPYTGRDIVIITSNTISYISIHSPYTGRDGKHECIQVRTKHFNPLSLYRERQSRRQE